MTDLQQRILTVMRNLGGSASPSDLRTKGNITKPDLAIESHLADMGRQGLVQRKLQSGEWFLVNGSASRPAAHRHKPTRKKSETRAKIETILQREPDAKPAAIAAQLGITVDGVYYHINRIRGNSMNSTKKPNQFARDTSQKNHRPSPAPVARMPETATADTPPPPGDIKFDGLTEKVKILRHMAAAINEALDSVMTVLAEDLQRLESLGAASSVGHVTDDTQETGTHG